MREIKFRAWDKEKKKFIGNEPIGLFNRILPVNWQDFFEVSQFTGLKDKNGKEIYEGDITLSKYGAKGGQYLIVRELSVYGIVFNRVYGSGSYFYIQVPQRETLEVIGNIYENPELLEDKNDTL